jgi:hypothetical protein
VSNLFTAVNTKPEEFAKKLRYRTIQMMDILYRKLDESEREGVDAVQDMQ